MPEEWVTGNVRLKVGDVPIDLEMTVPKQPVKLRKMLPIFGQMANSFLDVGIAKAESEGKTVSCAKGCGACCRQLVPVTISEAFEINELIENFPEPRRAAVKQRFADACLHFIENGWLARFDNSPNLTAEEGRKLVEEYFHEGVACPFLEDESCSIHQNRPLACREYLVTSPPVYCASFDLQKVKKVEQLFSIMNTVLNVEKTKITGLANFVPLICITAFADQIPQISIEKTGEEWMSEFFKNLKPL